MAVTLTSTGITFSDGNSQNTQASGGMGGVDTFYNSGTWTRPSGVTTVYATVVGGGGGGGGGQGNYGGAGGGGAGAQLWGTKTVNGNQAVTVGNGGASGYIRTGCYSPYQTDGTPGGSSSFSGNTSNGGGGGTKGTCYSNAAFNGGGGGSSNGGVSGETGAPSWKQSGRKAGTPGGTSGFGGPGKGGFSGGAGKKGVVIITY